MLGPFIIKEGREEMTKYAAMFSLITSGTAYIEITNSLEADIFILTLRRFIARRHKLAQILWVQVMN